MFPVTKQTHDWKAFSLETQDCYYSTIIIFFLLLLLLLFILSWGHKMHCLFIYQVSNYIKLYTLLVGT